MAVALGLIRVVWLGDVVRCVGVGQVVVRLGMWERRQVVVSVAGLVGPVPREIDRSSQPANDGLALFGDFVGVGVLVAHHDEGLAVDGKLVAEAGVADLEIVHGAIESIKSVPILRDLVSIPGDLLIVHVNLGVVIGHLPVGSVHAVLQVSD